MIVLINICKEKLHYHEFVKPIEDILNRYKAEYSVLHYKKVKKEELLKASKVIICGTSLYDNQFLKEIKEFDWIKDFEKPILGICGGMQILGLLYGGKIKKKSEIGYYKENFSKDFLGLFGEQEVYHLHNNCLKTGKELEIFSEGKIVQAFRHKSKPFYGVLFHPEVRQKKLISSFINL